MKCYSCGTEIIEIQLAVWISTEHMTGAVSELMLCPKGTVHAPHDPIITTPDPQWPWLVHSSNLHPRKRWKNY